MTSRSRAAGTRLIAVLAAIAFIAVGCGGSSDSTEEKKLQVFARSLAAGYRCMPKEEQRQYDRRARRLEQIGAAILVRNKDRSPEEQDRALRGNREYAQLAREASGLLARYLPRGSEYDAACYRRESRRHDRRVNANQGE